MIGNPQLEFKTVDAHTIEVEAKEITDEHIYKLDAIRKKLDTYNVKEMIWFEYDYEPYYSWGERQTVTPNKIKYKNYEELLNHLIEQSQSDRRNGWSNRINFLNITLKLEDKTTTTEKRLNDFEFNFTQNFVEFNKDELHLKDTHTKIDLKNGRMCITVFIPDINEFVKIKYKVSKEDVIREYMRLNDE